MDSFFDQLAEYIPNIMAYLKWSTIIIGPIVLVVLLLGARMGYRTYKRAVEKNQRHRRIDDER